MSPRFLLLVLTAYLAEDPVPTRGTEISVRVEVVDADSGRPIPSRVSIRGEDGSWFFPESKSPQGRAVPYRKTAIGHPSIVEMHTTLSAHPFTVRLPPGRYVITAERGKEYHPERRVGHGRRRAGTPRHPAPAMDRHERSEVGTRATPIPTGHSPSCPT